MIGFEKKKKKEKRNEERPRNKEERELVVWPPAITPSEQSIVLLYQLVDVCPNSTLLRGVNFRSIFRLCRYSREFTYF